MKKQTQIYNEPTSYLDKEIYRLLWGPAVDTGLPLTEVKKLIEAGIQAGINKEANDFAQAETE